MGKYLEHKLMQTLKSLVTDQLLILHPSKGFMEEILIYRWHGIETNYDVGEEII